MSVEKNFFFMESKFLFFAVLSLVAYNNHCRIIKVIELYNID